MSSEIGVLAEWSTSLGGVVVVAVQFLLGLALGYLTAKIFKYILAIIAILVLGSLLSVWSLDYISKETLAKIGVTLEALKSILFVFTAILIGPIAVGFVIGVLLGLLRK